MRLNLQKILVSFILCALTVNNVNPSYAVEEAALPVKFRSEVLPYFESARKGSFVGKDGVSIAWRAFPPYNGGTFQGAKALVVLNGRSEFMHKYAELVYDFRHSGYAIYLMDHRGQGESGRILSESQIGHVKNFRDYVDDLGTFMDQVVMKDGPSEVHVLAHSMGATVATIYAMEHPTAFRSMVLSGPMYLPNLGKYSECVALAIGGFMNFIGKGTHLAPGRTLDEWKNPFEVNNVTHSPNRFGYALDLLLAHPDEAIGGPTYRWVQQAIKGGRWIRNNAEKLTTPVRILQVGDERIVVPQYQNEVCGKAKACEIQHIDGSKHEILMEIDAYRNRALSLTLDWIERHSAKAL
ncbi:MAG: alpha/beta fold hydrolase [Bdellovibrionia bacterium]